MTKITKQFIENYGLDIFEDLFKCSKGRYNTDRITYICKNAPYKNGTVGNWRTSLILDGDIGVIIEYGSINEIHKYDISVKELIDESTMPIWAKREYKLDYLLKKQ
ncbi:MAG: hypothetical protein SLAVMIC_00994 [uncultured marine phage]|uniref:Uncharacterized protein n=1 Tax=uncultured marine phage TaxID=707152 RepID=A0A8D9C9U8_9VIRU|nr:MAG: hypothetical protein SLAVMIC_00994 [uncultured marine phage]